MGRQGASTVPASRLRRIALQRQGLLGQAPFGRGRAATLRAIERLGYVQIDTISVVSRAHDHVLQARVSDYDPEHIESLQRSRLIFEYWSHAAAYLPMSDFRYALPKMRAMARGDDRWIRCRDRRLMHRVLDQIRSEGPLQARDFEAPGRGAAAGWWNWKPAKQALEQLFMEGRLMVAGRRGFQKVYDLPERILPADADTRTPTPDEYARYLIRHTLNAHGFAGVDSMTYLRRGRELRQRVRRELDAMAGRGELRRFALAAQTPGGTERQYQLYAPPAILDRRAPPARAVARVLSPFDNLVIQRQRSQLVFGFDYQLECYLPAHKRRFGYFCLPLLYRDVLVGRADCKAHRQQGIMEIRSLFVEDVQAVIDDSDRCLAALGKALVKFARFNGCQAFDLGRVQPAAWRVPLRRALDAAGQD